MEQNQSLPIQDWDPDAPLTLEQEAYRDESDRRAYCFNEAQRRIAAIQLDAADLMARIADINCHTTRHRALSIARTHIETAILYLGSASYIVAPHHNLAEIDPHNGTLDLRIPDFAYGGQFKDHPMHFDPETETPWIPAKFEPKNAGHQDRFDAIHS